MKVGSIQLSEGWLFSDFGKFRDQDSWTHHCRVCSIGGGAGTIGQGDTSFQVIFQSSVATAIASCQAVPFDLYDRCFICSRLLRPKKGWIKMEETARHSDPLRTCCVESGLYGSCLYFRFFMDFPYWWDSVPRSEHTICRQDLPCTKYANTSSCNPTIKGPFALDRHNFSRSWYQMVMFLMEH